MTKQLQLAYPSLFLPPFPEMVNNRWQAVCVWHHNRIQTGKSASHQDCKLVRPHNCQVLASADSCSPLQEHWCFHSVTKRIPFFAPPPLLSEDLSVSQLSSHNKSLALSWGWALGASGEDKWPAGLWSALAVQMARRRWQRNIHNSVTNNENIKHSCLLTGWQESPAWHQSSSEA